MRALTWPLDLAPRAMSVGASFRVAEMKGSLILAIPAGFLMSLVCLNLCAPNQNLRSYDMNWHELAGGMMRSHCGLDCVKSYMG
jgi:hypothetical protein